MYLHKIFHKSEIIQNMSTWWLWPTSLCISKLAWQLDFCNISKMWALHLPVVWSLVFTFQCVIGRFSKDTRLLRVQAQIPVPAILLSFGVSIFISCQTARWDHCLVAQSFCIRKWAWPGWERSPCRTKVAADGSTASVCWRSAWQRWCWSRGALPRSIWMW